VRQERGAARAPRAADYIAGVHTHMALVGANYRDRSKALGDVSNATKRAMQAHYKQLNDENMVVDLVSAACQDWETFVGKDWKPPPGEEAGARMTWYFLLATGAFAVAYPESKRHLVHKIMAEKTLVYPDKGERGVTIVEVPAIEGDQQLLRDVEYLKKGEADGVCYALESVVDHFYVDQPGMIRVGRPTVVAEVPGLHLKTSAEDLDIVLDRIADSELKEIDGEEFYEIGFFLRTFVLGYEEKSLVVKALQAAAPEARRLAEEFDREYDATHPGKRAEMAQINAGTHAVGPNGLVELPGRMKPS